MISSNKAVILFQIGILFVFPVLLMLFEVFPFEARFQVGTFVAFLALWITIQEKWTLDDIGLKIGNIKSVFLPYFLVTLFGVFFIGMVARIIDLTPINLALETADHRHFFLPFLFFTSFLQEFLYRGFLIPKLQMLSDSFVFVIVFNAVLFGFMHVIFTPAIPLFFGSFFVGLLWAFMYLKYKNLLLISLSHMAWNAMAVYNCFMTGFPACP